MKPELKPEAIQEITQDFLKYCEKNFKIVDVNGKLVDLVPNQEQMELINYVINCLAKELPIRVIILKARKMGFSTIIEALMYWWTATHRYINSRVVAHDLESAGTLYKMSRRFYENSDPLFKPETKYFTKRELTFDNDVGNGLKSSMSIATADSANVGRGDTINWLHASELGSWKQGDKIAAGLMEAVPYVPNTAIFLESTAQGMGGFFYEMWQKSKRGETIYKPMFFPWYEHDAYRLNEEITPTAEERETMQRFNLENSQIAWYRMKRRSFNNKDAIKQEFPSTDQEAFLVSGRPRFDIEKLQAMELLVKEPEYYEIFLDNQDEVQTRKSELSQLKVWKLPREQRKYTIGADVAEGLSSGDYSVAEVMDKETMETVARWRGHIEPSEFGDVIWMLARWYNKALVGVEINNHGLTTVQRLRDRRYDNLYRREKGFDERLETYTAKLGWRTDTRTKPLSINALADAINERKIKDYDIVFVKECMTYVIDSHGRTNAQEGEHDDTVMAKAINLMLFEWSEVTQFKQNLRPKYPEKYRKMKANNRKLVKNRVK